MGSDRFIVLNISVTCVGAGAGFCFFFLVERRDAFGVLKSCAHHKLLFHLEVKKICMQKNYVTVTKKRNQVANSWICPYWFIRQEQ